MLRLPIPLFLLLSSLLIQVPCSFSKPVSIAVKIDTNSTSTDLVVTFYNKPQLVSTSYEVCTTYDLADEQCESLLNYVTIKYEEQQDENPTPIPTTIPVEKFSYSNVMKPSYLIPHNSLYDFPHFVPIIKIHDHNDLLHTILEQQFPPRSKFPSYNQSSITEAMSSHPYNDECIVIQIITKSVFVHSPNEHLHNKVYWWRWRRRNSVVALLIDILETSKFELNDAEFIFCPRLASEASELEEASSTNQLNSFGSLHSFCSCSIKNAPRFARCSDCLGPDHSSMSSFGYPRHYGGLGTEDEPQLSTT